jgi:hypothetical protein
VARGAEEGLLSRFEARSWLRGVGVVLAGAALIHCSGGTEYLLDGVEAEAPQALGTAGFHLDVGDGLTFRQLTATLTFPDSTFQTQTLDLSPEDTSLTIYLGELAVGTGYQITLSATSTTGSECTGTSKFRVKQDETVVVNVHMECSGGIAQPDVGAALIKGDIIPATGDCPAVIDRIEVAPSRAGIGVPISVEVFPTPGTAPIVQFGANGGQLAVVTPTPAGGGAQGGGAQGGGAQGGGAQGGGAQGGGAQGGGAQGGGAQGGGAQGGGAQGGGAPAGGGGQNDDDDAPPAVSTVAGSSTRATFRCTTAGQFEIYADVTRAGCVHHAEAHVKCFDDGTPYTGSAGTGGAAGSGMGGGGGGNTPTGGAAGTGNTPTGGAAGMGQGGGPPTSNNACATCTASNCPAQVSACQNEPTSTACGEIRVCANVGAAESCASNSSLDCYCGTRPIATCLSFGGNGECADVITRASGCNDGRAPENVPTCVSERFLDVDFGLGDAFQLIACQRRNCSTQCGLLQ